jgi:hypothetical protein
MIFKHKTDYMREVVRLVAHGYHWYTSGTTDPKKLSGLMLKFDDRYSINATPQQRYRRKSKGDSNAQFLAWQDETGAVLWLLLVTEGGGIVRQLESLRDCREKKSRIGLTGYELVKTPRKGEGASAQWTWRIDSENYAAWEERLKTAVRKWHPHNDDLIKQALWSLRRVPGFSESRHQAFALEKFAQGQWKRTQRGDWPFEGVFIGWLGRYQKPTLLDISALLKANTHKKSM